MEIILNIQTNDKNRDNRKRNEKTGTKNIYIGNGCPTFDTIVWIGRKSNGERIYFHRYIERPRTIISPIKRRPNTPQGAKEKATE